MCRRVRLTARLGRSVSGLLPAREHENCRMATQGAGENLRTLNAEAYTLVFDRRQGSLGNAAKLSKLVLAQPLKLANDAHRLANGNIYALLRWVEILHLTFSVIETT